jgi:FkbM family methyltransferase
VGHPHRSSRERLAASLARLAAHVGRLPLGFLARRSQSLLMSRLVNLVARATWELFMRWAPQGTTLRCRLSSGPVLDLDLSERIQGQAALTGEYDPILCESIAESLSPGGVFLDVGANVGLVTLEVAGRAGSKRPRVHAFEPHPDNLAALKRNLDLNPDVRVEVIEAAAGAQSGSATLLASPSRSEAGAHRIVAGEDGRGQSATFAVPMTTIDQHLEEAGVDHVDALKIDAEGHEASVIAGAEQLLSRRAADLVILEVSVPLIEALGRTPGDLDAAMSRHGYAGTLIDSASPTRLFPRMRHLAPDDVAFRPRTAAT